ncbi:hypothetical protein EC957_005619 [Mortierella hygrophila]|uniref:Major facilitator superfamily (MFS) profile domain-containing protein n=1 Tax=Mortierella hygrophila TaxID=979708 RepID=A0A9P6F0P1_9FUNG|nr:hypothetical protein EC957_005619 [Mortierella hygrophila]
MEATPTTTIATTTVTATPSSPPYDAGGALDIPPSTTASTVEASIHGFDSNEKSIYDNKLESDLEQQNKPSNYTPTGIRRFLLLLGLFLGCILAALDNTIVATALPQISSDFNAQSQMAWIATAYLLAYTAFQSLYGRFSDIFGLKTMYLGASVIFLIGSIGCGAASSMIMLIIFRAVQGIGGAGLLSIMMIMVSVMFDDINERARYQTLAYLAFGVSGICGPLLGGVFVEHSTWRWCFYMNIPIGVFAMLLVFKFYQIPFERTETLQKKLGRVDYFGVLITIDADGTTYDWDSAVIISLFCVMGVLIIVLVFVEQRAAEPIIPMYLFLNREVALLVTVNFLTGLIFNGCGFYIPLYFQVVQGTSVTDSGLRLMPAVLGAVFSTGSSGFFLAKVKDYRRFISLGAATLTLSVGLFIMSDENTSLAKQLIFVLIMGLGQGFIYQNCVLACQDCTEAKDMAVATGFVVFINSIGNAVGVAVCAAVINNSLTTNLAKLPKFSQALFRELNVIENINVIFTLSEELKAEVVHAYALAFRTLFTILTPMIGLGFVLSLFVRRRGSLAKKE